MGPLSPGDLRASDPDRSRELIRQGRLEEVVKDLRRFADTAPPATVGALAGAYALRGNWDRAERYARTWIAGDPASDAARCLLVIALTVRKRRQDAIREARDAVAAFPESAAAWATLCYAQLPTRSPSRWTRPNVDYPWQAGLRCIELNRDGLLGQAVRALVGAAADDTVRGSIADLFSPASTIHASVTWAVCGPSECAPGRIWAVKRRPMWTVVDQRSPRMRRLSGPSGCSLNVGQVLVRLGMAAYCVVSWAGVFGTSKMTGG